MPTTGLTQPLTAASPQGWPPDPPLPWLTRALLAFDRGFMSAYHRVEHLTPSYLPHRGPAIIAPNHTSSLDPLIVQSATPRLIHWMMAAEYLEITALRWFFKAARIIPVQRTGDARDSAAVRSGLKVLADGGLLGIFPEGRISKSGGIGPLQPGIALLQRRARVPIYPVLIGGTQTLQSMASAVVLPQHSTLSFAPPQNFSDSRQELEQLSSTYHKLLFRH